MKYQNLLSRSRHEMKGICPDMKVTGWQHVFRGGACWMLTQMNRRQPDRQVGFNDAIPFNLYGLMKYTLSLFGFLYTFIWFTSINIYLAPLAVPVFYLIEVHFLFLFPMLLDQVKKPVCLSISIIYKAGFFSCLFNLIPIGLFMMFGLVNLKSPLKNWYIGCLSIIIWYQDEIRDRI